MKLYYSNTYSGITMKLRAMSNSTLVYSNIHCKRYVNDDGIAIWELEYKERKVK